MDEALARPAPPGSPARRLAWPNCLVGRERQLERRALDVIDEDVQVVGIDERALGRRVEEIRRVADDELIERRAARHQHRRRPARSAGPRGRRAARSRRSCPDSRPSPTRRARRCRCRARARWSRRRRAPALRAAPSRSRGGGSAGSRRDSRGCAPARPAAPSKSSFRYVVRISVASRLCANTISCRLRLRNSSATRRVSAEIRAADAELLVDDRRVDEDEELLAARRAALVDELERLLGQPLGQLARIGDRRRRADERPDPTRSAGRCGAAAAARCTGGCRTRRDTRAARR